jgi:hypothetical protein
MGGYKDSRRLGFEKIGKVGREKMGFGTIRPEIWSQARTRPIGKSRRIPSEADEIGGTEARTAFDDARFLLDLQEIIRSTREKPSIVFLRPIGAHKTVPNRYRLAPRPSSSLTVFGEPRPRP